MEPIGQFDKIAKQKLDTKVSSDKKIKKEIEKKNEKRDNKTRMVSYPVKGHSFRNPVEVLTDTSRKEWEQALSLEPNGFHCGFHCEIHSELQ